MAKTLLLLVVALLFVSCAKEQDSPTSNPRYLNYSPEAVQNQEGRRLLYFHAPWCFHCQALDADIRSSKLPKDVTVFKVDYDSNNKLRKKHGVRIRTTLVLLDEDGATVNSYIARNPPTWEAVKKALLE
jgi:thioredoxin-related protein